MSSLPEHGQIAWLQRCADADRRWARSLHRASRLPVLTWLLVVVSWLGNGPLWYATILGLAVLGGPQGLPCALRMLAAGCINLGLYLCLKRGIGRPRPHVACPDIRQCTRALDQFSFPSGHTLHSVAFSLVITHYYPELAYVLWPFVFLVAISRVTLGLHYPSDVAAGCVIGAVVALGVLA